MTEENDEALVTCHFTAAELKYFSEVIYREKVLVEFVRAHLKPLRILGIELFHLPTPNVMGKLHSYLKKGIELERAKRK